MGSESMDNPKRLREIIASPGIHVGPGVYDCLGAKIVEKFGFELVFTSGFGISGSTLGRPDYGYLTATEMLYTVGRIAKSVSIPLIADADTGYGNPLNVMRTVSDIVPLGVAGIILEDQQWPKKCGHFEGKRLIAKAEHVEKIHAAVEARGLRRRGVSDQDVCRSAGHRRRDAAGRVVRRQQLADGGMGLPLVYAPAAADSEAPTINARDNGEAISAAL